MIVYLLLPALILGNVESQTTSTNMTQEEWSNQTFTESTTNNTTTPVNVTSSLSKDERTLIEDELQSNQTSVVMEDDENFQEQDVVFRHCDEEKLVQFSHIVCGEDFHEEMMAIGSENWCVMKDIIRPYNDMTVCLESLSHIVGCYYPNPNIQDFFLYIHSSYFLNCTKDERPLVDAPQGLVIALTLIPVSLIPLLVYLVVWKSSVQE